MKAYLEGSKVDDTVNGRVLGKNLVDGSLVGDVNLVEVGAATT